MTAYSLIVVGGAAGIGILGVVIGVRVSARRRAKAERHKYAAIEAEFRPVFEKLREKE